jgi:hypothetical protein
VTHTGVIDYSSKEDEFIYIISYFGFICDREIVKGWQEQIITVGTC